MTGLTSSQGYLNLLFLPAYRQEKNQKTCLYYNIFSSISSECHQKNQLSNKLQVLTLFIRMYKINYILLHLLKLLLKIFNLIQQ